MASEIIPRELPSSRARAGWAIALAATVCFSLAPTLASAGIRQGIPATALLMLRMVISAALLFIAVLGTDRSLFRIDGKGLAICALGGLSNGLGMLAFFASLTRIDSSIAAMIFSVSPLVTLLLLAWRGEKFTYRNTLRVALGLGGLYLLIGPGGRVDAWGAALAGVSVFTVPFLMVLMQWYLAQYDSRTVTFYTVAVMAIVVGGWWWFQDPAWLPLDGAGWAIVLALAVTTFLARIGLFAGIKRIGGGEMGMLAPLETLLTVVWSMSFLGDAFTLGQWLGGGLIVLSAALAVQRLGRVNWRELAAKAQRRAGPPA